MKLVGRAEPGQWKLATTEYEKVMAKAATLSMRQIGKLAEKKAREAVAAAGFTTNVQRTIQAVNQPRKGYVLNPSVWLHSTVNYLDVFETGRTITGSPLLWLPLPNVPPNVGAGVSKEGGLISRPHMTPRQYIRKVGPLIKVITQRHGGLIMLGALVEKGGKVTRGKLRRTFLHRVFKEKSKQTIFVPLFIGIARITIPKKFDIAAATKNAFEQLEAAYHEIVQPDEERLSGN